MVIEINCDREPSRMDLDRIDRIVAQTADTDDVWTNWNWRHALLLVHLDVLLYPDQLSHIRDCVIQYLHEEGLI